MISGVETTGIHRLRVPAGRAVLKTGCTALLLLFAAWATLRAGVQGPRETSSASPVLSQNHLNPPLRSEIRQVRFSPDDSHILVQDAAGIYILTRQPLAEILWIPAAGTLPAAFTSDSRQLVIASAEMQYAQVSALAPEDFSPQTIPNSKGCLAAALSANGTRLGCISPTGVLEVFELPEGKQIFSSRIPFTIDGLAAPLDMNFLAQISDNSVFSQPIGDFRTKGLAVLAGMTNPARIVFSPDGRYVLAEISRINGLAVGADLSIPRKIGVPGELSRHLQANPVFVSDAEAAVVDPAKPQSSGLISFPEGRMVYALPASTRVAAATDGQYLFLETNDGSALQIFNVHTGKTDGTVPGKRADIRGGEVAACDAGGNVTLSTLGGAPESRITLPTEPISDLRIAASSPDLSLLALGVGTGAAIFNPSTGARWASYESATAVWCNGDNSCYIGKPSPPPQMLDIEPWSPIPDQKKVVPVSFLQDIDPRDPFRISQLIYSGPVVLEYAPRVSATMPTTIMIGPAGVSTFSSPFRPGLGIHLRALNISDGRQRWWIEKEDEAPIPFSDPQGDRLILGWSAKSRSGHQAAKRFPAAYERLKSAKLSPYDTFFQVVDDRTGNPLGGTLVQAGSGAMAFDSAFSEGDWLILTKDGHRILVVSLQTGETKLTLFGDSPSLSANGEVFSFVSAPTQITLYDMKTLTKIAAYNFPAPIAYTHFSGDGKRILVLTSNQMVYVLNSRAGVAGATTGSR